MFFGMLTSKCALCHNGARFFDILTSKSAPRPPVCFTFDFEICFAPQRRALFQHLNFQKCSETGVLCILTTKCASRHNGVHFFNISSSKNAPVLVCFVRFFIVFPSKCASRRPAACNFSSLISPDGSAPAALASLLFSPLEPQNIGNNTVFGDFSTFRAPASSFFRSFSSLIFCLLTHLCFSIYPYCRKFDFEISFDNT